jgi:hypothetical protein
LMLCEHRSGPREERLGGQFADEFIAHQARRVGCVWVTSRSRQEGSIAGRTRWFRSRVWSRPWLWYDRLSYEGVAMIGIQYLMASSM